VSDYDQTFDFDYGNGDAWPVDFVTTPHADSSSFRMSDHGYTMGGLGIDESGFGGLGIIDAIVSKKRADKEREHRKREDGALAERLATVEAAAGIVQPTGELPPTPAPASPLPKIMLAVAGLVGVALLVKLVRR